MPKIDLTFSAGALPDDAKRELPGQLGAALIRWEGAPDTEFFRSIAWTHVHELPAEAAAGRTLRWALPVDPVATVTAASTGGRVTSSSRTPTRSSGSYLAPPHQSSGPRRTTDDVSVARRCAGAHR